MASLAEAIQVAKAKIEAKSRPESIWPERFDDTPEGAYRFVLAQHTWNESEGEIQPFPDKEFLRDYCYEWHTCFKQGRMLVTEKCRRMVISWCARSLELHQMGLRRTDCILCGEKLEAAAKHVWRLKFLYTELQKRHPSWRLPDSKELKFEGEKKLSSFWLPNGSTTNYANGQATGLQGDGVRIITLEEFGLYPYASSMLGQAKIITQGKPGTPGGFVNIITNANANPQWQLVKRGAIPIAD